MEYITPKQAALKWEITERRVQALCAGGKVNGVVRFGHVWAIPRESEKPRDGRFNRK